MKASRFSRRRRRGTAQPRPLRSQPRHYAGRWTVAADGTVEVLRSPRRAP